MPVQHFIWSPVCSLAGAYLCEAAAKPAARKACGLTPCQVASGGLTLQLGPWDACEATCGSGLAARSGYCSNPLGFLADPAACSSYSGMALWLVPGLLPYVLRISKRLHCQDWWSRVMGPSCVLHCDLDSSAHYHKSLMAPPAVVTFV